MLFCANVPGLGLCISDLSKMAYSGGEESERIDPPPELNQLRRRMTMFEISRKKHIEINLAGGEDLVNDEKLIHFDPDIHTLEAMALGIEHHHPITSREIVEADLPQDRSTRNRWFDDGVAIIILPEGGG